MPNIPEFNAPIQPLTPYEGSATTAREAGMVENKFAREEGESLSGAIIRSGKQFGDMIDRHENTIDISNGMSAGSSMYTGLQQQLNDSIKGSKINDLTFGQKFLEQSLKPVTDNFMKAFEGSRPQAQEWAQNYVGETIKHFTGLVNSETATRTGLMVENNVNTAGQMGSVAAYNDPTSLDFQINSMRTGFQAVIDANPMLTPGDAEKLKSEILPKQISQIAKSAYMGLARNNPDEALAQLNAGKFDDKFSGEEKSWAETFGHEMQRNKLGDDERAFELQKRQDDLAAQTSYSDYTSKLLNPATSAADRKNLLSNSLLDPNFAKFGQMKHSLYEMSTQYTKQLKDNVENAQHPESMNNLMGDAIKMEHTDPNNFSIKPFEDAFTQGKLSIAELNKARSFFSEPDKYMQRNFLTQYGNVARSLRTGIDGHIMATGNPAEFAQTINQIRDDTWNQIQSAKDKGENVNNLLDPKNKDYLFSPAKMQMYMAPATTQLQTSADQVKSGAVAPIAERKLSEHSLMSNLNPNDATLNKAKEYTAGQITGGYKFKGGDATKQENWEKVK